MQEAALSIGSSASKIGTKFMGLKRSIYKSSNKLRSLVARFLSPVLLRLFPLKRLYRDYLNAAFSTKTDVYVPLSETHIDADKSILKLIAFYLPQFHPLEVNDKAWGKGFTEWTNVSKATPQFKGHYQPRLPGELGFYDLRLKEVQQRQIELARQYGIHGFCYYHYWFHGKRIMEAPFQQVLDNHDLDLPFCLCWANENWTRRWDGAEEDVLLSQEHSAEDDIAFIKDIEPALKDSRYIRIDGRPLLILYRPELLPDALKTAERWRTYARESGIGELYLASTAAFGFHDYEKIGFDALIQFPPHNIKQKKAYKTLYNLSFNGHIHDYTLIPQKALEALDPEKNHFPTVMMEWDNEARKPGQGSVFYGASPAIYQQWLSDAGKYVVSTKNPKEQFVFINAWNEWAEGTYLEPDRKYGYAYLQATANAVHDFYLDP